MPTVRQSAEVTISDLSDAANASLTSYSFVFSATKDGVANAGSCTVGASVFIGSTQVDCSVNNSNIIVPTTSPDSGGVSTSVSKATGSMTPVVTITVNNKLKQSDLDTRAFVTIPISFSYQGETVTINKDFGLALAKKGENGSVPYNYFLTASPTVVVRDPEGSGASSLSTTSISWSATRGQTGTPSTYTGGRIWAHYTTDGDTWTQLYKSSATESTGSGTLSLTSLSDYYATIKAVRITLHTGTPSASNQVDVVTIPFVDSGHTGPGGQTGPKGDDAYTVLLTNEAHTFPATAGGNAVAGSVTTGVIAYKGATAVTPTIGTITGQTSGKITASVSGTTITVTVTASLNTRSGELTIPVTVDGKSFTKKFSWSLAPTGEKGDGGLSMSIESNNGIILRNNSGNTTVTAKVWQDGAEVTGSALSSLGTIYWYKNGVKLTGSETGITLSGASVTVDASAVDNKAVFTAKLEG